MKLRNPDPLLLSKIEDKLFVKSQYIDKIYDLVISNIEAPYAISIDGDWGAGKTTVMKLLESKLIETGYPTFWFNPWEYKGSSNITLSFLQNLANSFPEEIKNRGQKIGWFFKLLSVSSIDFVSRVISNGGLSLEIVNKNAELIEKELPNWRTFQNIVDEIRNEFVDLVRKIVSPHKNKPLFIFIDDFDRCLPDDTIKLLEAIKNLFVAKNEKGDIANAIFIGGINTEIAKFFIQSHYRLSRERKNDAISYFRKIFNLTLHIPYSVMIEELVGTYLEDLEVEQVIGDINFVRVISEEGRYFNVTSIRQYQNILNNYTVVTKLNAVKSVHEKKAIFYMLILKELSYDTYQKMKRLIMSNPQMLFEWFYNDRQHISQSRQWGWDETQKSYLHRFLDHIGKNHISKTINPFQLLTEYLI